VQSFFIIYEIVCASIETKLPLVAVDQNKYTEIKALEVESSG